MAVVAAERPKIATRPRRARNRGSLLFRRVFSKTQYTVKPKMGLLASVLSLSLSFYISLSSHISRRIGILGGLGGPPATSMGHRRPLPAFPFSFLSSLYIFLSFFLSRSIFVGILNRAPVPHRLAAGFSEPWEMYLKYSI